MEDTEAPPPYSPFDSAAPTSAIRGRTTLPTLPLHILHLVLSYTLDPQATPSKWYTSIEEELPRRRYALFRGVRPVCRSLRKVSMAILRQHYLGEYTKSVVRGCTSDPMSPLPSSSRTSNSAYSPMGHSTHCSLDEEEKTKTQGRRETTILDRFIAIRLGLELRAAESSLTSDDSPDSLRDIFSRLQPSARVEDLLYSLPPELVSGQRGMGPVSRRGLPLPWEYLGVSLTPGWCQLYRSSIPLGSSGGGSGGERRGREVVLEARRGRTCEETAQNVAVALGAMRRGDLPWGDRYST